MSDTTLTAEEARALRLAVWPCALSHAERQANEELIRSGRQKLLAIEKAGEE